MIAESKQFTIRRAFLVPLALLLVLSLALLVVVLLNRQPPGKGLILAMMILPIAGLFVESVFRKAVIGEEDVTVYKFLRKKTIRFAEATSLDTVQVRKRAFVTLSADDDFLILSNAYGHFPELVRTLLSRVPQAVISEETRLMAKSPPVKSSDILSCWLAVTLLAFILYIQMGGAV